jgi:site-specific recombinase XerD
MSNNAGFLEDVMEEVGQMEILKQGFALFGTVAMPARNFSAQTRKSYHGNLTDLLAFLEKRGMTKLAQVDLQDLERYMADMDRREYKPSTRRRKTYAVKSWFKFLHHQGTLVDNLASRLIPPRPEKQEPRFLSEEEYQQLLRVCSHHPRDAAMIEVLLQTGMRLSELAQLTLADVEIPKRITCDPVNTGSVRVTRKGRKTQVIPLNYKACQALDAYLKIRPEVDHEALFVTRFKEPMSPRAIQYRVQKYFKEAGIKGASVHTPRHTMATHHAAHGTDLKTIQETLGHADLATTSIFVSLAKKAQRQALQEHAL